VISSAPPVTGRLAKARFQKASSNKRLLAPKQGDTAGEGLPGGDAVKGLAAAEAKIEKFA
jgi:hypothetical protein